MFNVVYVLECVRLKKIVMVFVKLKKILKVIYIL